MMGRKRCKKTQTCPKWWSQGSQEDKISQLPHYLVCDILSNISTKDAVSTSVLSTKWRSLWKLVPGLDLDTCNFSDVNAFVSFVERFFEFHGGSWIRKLRLRIRCVDPSSYLSPWIDDALTNRRIQHLDVYFQRYNQSHALQIPLSLYACETLVHLQLAGANLVDAEVVSLSCLKTLHLQSIIFPNEAFLEKLISRSPVLEDLTIIRSVTDNLMVLQVRSETLKRFSITQFDKGNELRELVIDAPLLQFLRINACSTEDIKIINLGLAPKVVTNASFGVVNVFDLNVLSKRDKVHSFLSSISKVRDLEIGQDTVKVLYENKRAGPRFHFPDLTQLSARILNADLKMLPPILMMCPKLESIKLELVDDGTGKKPELMMFPLVPRCMKSSLKHVELKNMLFGYEGETQLATYFLTKSTTLERLTLRLSGHYMKKDVFEQLLAIPRRSTNACQFVLP